MVCETKRLLFSNKRLVPGPYEKSLRVYSRTKIYLKPRIRNFWQNNCNSKNFLFANAAVCKLKRGYQFILCQSGMGEIPSKIILITNSNASKISYSNKNTNTHPQDQKKFEYKSESKSGGFNLGPTLLLVKSRVKLG